MSIEKYSPRLRGSLQRKVPSVDLKLIEDCFALAINNGGLLELDYKREEGMSFNPRPARIACILIEDAGARSTNAIAAGIVSTVWYSLSAKEQDALPDSLRRTAELSAADCPSKLEQLEKAEQHEVRLIQLCSYLDRARHLHLADTNVWRSVYDECEAYSELAKQHCAPLHTLLTSWQGRFARNRSF